MTRLPTLRSAWTWLRGEPWRLAAATIGFAATLVGLVLGVLELADRLFPPPQPSDPSVAIVLESSDAMAKPFGSGSAFEAARDRLGTVLEEEREHNVELRVFGGDCGKESDRLVGWGTDNAERFGEELDAVQPEGRADLATAIVDATRDFDDRSRFPDEIVKRIVVITSGHTCPDDAQAAIRAHFRRLGESRGIGLDFRFIGLDVPLEERTELEEIARALDAGTPAYPSDEDELEAALAAAAVDEPLLAGAIKMNELVTESLGDLNTCADLVYDEPDADEAEVTCGRARAAVEKSNQAFGRLPDSYARSELNRIREIYVEQLRLQGELVKQADGDLELASRHEGEQEEAVGEAVADWNVLVEAHNDADEPIPRLFDRLRE
jgi:von Willebrand factor type A domain